MEFLKIEKQELNYLISNATKQDLQTLLEYCLEFLNNFQFHYLKEDINSKTIFYKTTKQGYVDLFMKLFNDDDFIKCLSTKLQQTEKSAEIYRVLIWEESDVIGQEYEYELNLGLKYEDDSDYGSSEYALEDNLSLIQHHLYYSWQGLADDVLFVKSEIRELLKLAYPVPNNYNLSIVQIPQDTKYTYSNEDGIFQFISTIQQMLKSNLVEFGKSNEKPLLKSLNILKSSSAVREFYDNKKLGLNATDMLTRSFSYYYWTQKSFKDEAIQSLKDYVLLQFENRFSFFITRILAGHLKKVRFDEFYTSQKELFDLLKLIIVAMPKDGFVSIKNILSYCKYRNLGFHFDSSYKTNEYNMQCDIQTRDGDIIVEHIRVKEYYDLIYFDPILKASFYFLASLGLFELKYDEPKSQYNITAKGKDYITIWDNLEYIKFTQLGLYVFGYNKTYEVKKIETNSVKLKFDEYKPIITVDPNDSIMLAKLEPYTIEHDKDKYILNYAKIFRDCKTTKALNIKIDGFYNNIEQNPPKIFIDFFNDIKRKSNMLSNESKYSVIELKNNKELLNLFMTNKRLQEIIIKAEGYRVVLLKSDMIKFTRIVKENGFFVEF